MAVDFTDKAYSQIIAERHLLEVAKAHCTKWTLLPPLLGLDSAVQDDIERSGREPVEKRLNFLREWKQRKGSEATYNALISALQGINCQSDAEFVMSLIEPQLNVPQKNAHTQTEITSEETIAHDELPLTPNEKVQIDLKQQLRRNLKKIGRQYASYVYYICTSLQERNVTPENLATFLLKLPALQVDADDENLKLLAGLRIDLKNANEIVDLVDEKYASFLNYDVFQDIVENYKLWSIDNAEVFKYPEYLKTYIEKHTISEFLEINPELAKASKNSDEIALKFEIDINKYKLGSIIKVKSIIADILEIQESSLRLFCIKEGCMIATFLIPTPVALFVFHTFKALSNERKKRFHDLSVIWLKYTDTDGTKILEFGEESCSVEITETHQKQQLNLMEEKADDPISVQAEAFDLRTKLRIDVESYRKLAVLLAEQHYLEENIGDPGRYIIAFKKKGILTEAQCCYIREQRSVECQMEKFLELISMDERSFTVFVNALRAQRVHGHVATYLKKKATEMEKFFSKGEGTLLIGQQRMLVLVEFSHRTQINHDLARDILSGVEWDLSRALEAAERMNYPQDTLDSDIKDHKHFNRPEMHFSSAKLSPMVTASLKPQYAHLIDSDRKLKHVFPPPPDSTKVKSEDDFAFVGSPLLASHEQLPVQSSLSVAEDFLTIPTSPQKKFTLPDFPGSSTHSNMERDSEQLECLEGRDAVCTPQSAEQTTKSSPKE